MELDKPASLPTADASSAPSSPLRAADALVDILVAHGVDVIFGLPGGPISPLIDALLDRPEIRVVNTRSEGAAMFAAAGYAHASGKLGVAMVTTGPGVLNAMTGLTSAFCDGLPVLLLAGEVARRNFGRGALQDGSAYGLHIVEMLRNVTKHAAEVHDAQRAPAMLKSAIRTALSGSRGPVALTLPMDVTLANLDALPSLSLPPIVDSAVASDAIAAAAALMRESERGLLFVGSGVRSGAAPARLVELAERAQWPVVTTPKGKGVFPEDHPLSLGVFGMGGHVSAYEYLEKGVDTIVAVGTSFNELSTDGWSALLQPSHALVHVDIDERQFGRAYPCTLGIVGNAEQFLARLTAELPQAAERHFGGVRRHVLPLGTGAGLPMHHAISEIQRALPENTIFTVDSGEHFVFATHYLKLTAPDSYLVMTGLGSMGQSLPAAVGAQLAHPDRVVATIVGDGCFAMNAFEIATAVNAKLPLVIFVINDGRLGMVEIGSNNVYGRTADFATGPMDIPQLAAALGAQTVVADMFGVIRDADLMEMRKRGPVVVDVRIDATIKIPKRERFIGFAPKRRRRGALN
ncbi:MAG: thiamine pyrophosphate-binding protein [Myxococcales bacterium]|nr:thiamine pyrophosphate-binding protein [Myxococcales bacterium]